MNDIEARKGRAIRPAQPPVKQVRRKHAAVLTQGLTLGLALLLGGCMLGPDYRRPAIDIPASFKEDDGITWLRTQADPQAALPGNWWTAYGDEQLGSLIDRALAANQNIAAAEASYRAARASVASSEAGLYPTLSAGASASRSRNLASSGSSSGSGTQSTLLSTQVSASATASWEPDLWGEVRRQVEASRGSAQASGALLAGQRLSIAATLANSYFALRQLDIDIALLGQQERIRARVLEMTRASFQHGLVAADQVLVAQDNLAAAIATLAASRAARAQYEHAIAVLTGVPPAAFAIAAQPDYRFALPPVPLALPSQLLQRRPDVVAAERNAAAANARIGVAQAAFFPSLTLSAQAGYRNNSLAQLFTAPHRFWTVGPALAGTLFDGGARSAALESARAGYDQSAANYRQTVLGAFQSVEDSLASYQQLQNQASAFAGILQRNQQLFASARAQRSAGSTSELDLLSQQLALLTAEQNLRDTQGLLTQSSVTLIRNLGGGWQWDDTQGAPAPASSATASSSTPATPHTTP
ncbi:MULTISPECIES: efflux transporter outer membrane subunit [unclassified Variovorax]|jgi:NodT family efflux transporter outer membrane factor (OMF) lipoprotein|uniref:efflux transporter outer membrane subunit n=1 Tax=unclassified Variovorax TaxID=663243 RepID=UPI000F7E2690|nr:MULTISPECIES: efflux transporter outer membrane subunit [unclassified Variovorax]RSZ29801.1 efflux transporter outer membrane subunit [Variovorax sp. 553]RSZ30379.1 efflux transporter outer membrane subunit [Variovorax sp. 679]